MGTLACSFHSFDILPASWARWLAYSTLLIHPPPSWIFDFVGHVGMHQPLLRLLRVHTLVANRDRTGHVGMPTNSPVKACFFKPHVFPVLNIRLAVLWYELATGLVGLASPLISRMRTEFVILVVSLLVRVVSFVLWFKLSINLAFFWVTLLYEYRDRFVCVNNGLEIHIDNFLSSKSVSMIDASQVALDRACNTTFLLIYFSCCSIFIVLPSLHGFVRVESYINSEIQHI